MTTQVSPNYPTPFAPYVLTRAQNSRIPLICDSPHSGVKYPKDFQFFAPFHLLRTGEDTDIDTLWNSITSVGGTLLAAQFPRSYIDPNRDVDDIDTSMLSAPWPSEVNPTEKSRLGFGLIWKTVDSGQDSSPIYNRLLSPQEVQARIDTYYTPYHTALREQIESVYQQFGHVWHLNLHSMPFDAYLRLDIPGEHKLADFVLGNRDGLTCSEEFIEMVADALRSKGYTVAINDPYKGVALIARLGKPEENRHSLQIEVNRYLYMNEKTRAPNAGFEKLQANLNLVAQEIAAYIRNKVK